MTNSENSVYIDKLTRIEIDDIDEMQMYLDLGNKTRISEETKMNEASSRGHSIFRI